MNIFITVYHAVRNVFLFPLRLVEKRHQKKLIQEVKEEEKKKEERRKQALGISHWLMWMRLQLMGI